MSVSTPTAWFDLCFRCNVGCYMVSLDLYKSNQKILNVTIGHIVAAIALIRRWLVHFIHLKVRSRRLIVSQLTDVSVLVHFRWNWFWFWWLSASELRGSRTLHGTLRSNRTPSLLWWFSTMLPSTVTPSLLLLTNEMVAEIQWDVKDLQLKQQVDSRTTTTRTSTIITTTPFFHRRLHRWVLLTLRCLSALTCS